MHEVPGQDDASDLYDHAPCGYLSTTPDGLIVKVNQTFLSLTGFRREDLVEKRDFADLLSPGGRIYHETHYLPMLQTEGQAREIAFDLLRADGARLPVLVTSTLKPESGGVAAFVRVAVFDATELRGYEQELLSARKRAEAAEAQATALARALEQTLVPPEPPAIQGLDIAARYLPSGVGHLVGGDFYDVFQVGDDEWVVLLGDVCGKGTEAAIVTSLARYTLRGACVPEALPSRALARLNDELLRHRTDRYCTVALLRLRRDGHRWSGTVSCGGHPLPILRRANGQTSPIGRPGTLLGILPDPDLSDAEIWLDPGDAVVLFTDGITESRRGDSAFGNERLRASIAAQEGSADSMATSLVAQVLEFQPAQRDDIALVVVRYGVGS
jgi:phosphoserine phosphatase RsbU/P